MAFTSSPKESLKVLTSRHLPIMPATNNFMTLIFPENGLLKVSPDVSDVNFRWSSSSDPSNHALFNTELPNSPSNPHCHLDLQWFKPSQGGKKYRMKCQIRGMAITQIAMRRKFPAELLCFPRRLCLVAVHGRRRTCSCRGVAEGKPIS